MAVADLVAEWFETDLLRGTIAAQGIFGTFLGPWSAGSSATLLLRSCRRWQSRRSSILHCGRSGALTAAMAGGGTEAGAEIRTSCEVVQHQGQRWRGDRSRPRNGDEIEARAVISNADPKRTLLGLVEPQHLQPASCKSFSTTA